MSSQHRSAKPVASSLLLPLTHDNRRQDQARRQRAGNGQEDGLEVHWAAPHRKTEQAEDLQRAKAPEVIRVVDPGTCMDAHWGVQQATKQALDSQMQESFGRGHMGCS